MNQELGKKLLSILKEEQVKKDEPMKSHTTFRVGGPADYFVTPQTAEEVAKVIEACTQEKVPYYIVGNGSNLLVSDKGYEGVIIQIYKQMNQVKVEGAQIHAQAGALLSMIAKRALDAELTGFEFAAGIPGTLGGACVMNAGAYGGEMKDVLKSVTVLTDKGEVKTLAKEELELGYRTSVIAKKGYIVLEAVLELQKGEKEKIQAVMDDLKERRVTKQPLEYPSAGSTFKRPEGYFAGKLIMEHRKLFKNVCANVDFYSGFVYTMLGIPEELFTPIFAIARMPGWSAHRLEELISANKIIRPAYKYVGHHTDFVPFDER